MENETNETIIDSTENNDQVEEETTDESPEVEETLDVAEEETHTHKTIENPEAKRARLARMLSQHDRKHGITSEETVSKVKTPSKELSTEELYALIKADVPQEDIVEVREYAQLKNISVADALNSNVVKTILKDKKDERNVAQATNTGASKRGSSRLTEDALIQKAVKGEMPDSDEDIKRMFRAKKGLK